MISGVFKSFASVTIIRILEFILLVDLIRQVPSLQILVEMVAIDLILVGIVIIITELKLKGYPVRKNVGSL